MNNHIAEVGKMIDWDKPLRTKSGLPVRLVTNKATDLEYRRHGVIVEGKDFDTYIIYKNDGSYQSHPNELDLENVPEKIVRYVNLYEKEGPSWFYKSRQDSDKAASCRIGGSRIACIRVEFEVGQFDE